MAVNWGIRYLFIRVDVRGPQDRRPGLDVAFDAPALIGDIDQMELMDKPFPAMVPGDFGEPTAAPATP
jgi:hypothetical protein